MKGPLQLGTSLSRRVRVPYPIESPLSGLAFGGAAAGLTRFRYRRTFAVPAKWGWPLYCRVRLHFGAIDWQAMVYVNGIRVGAHSGGFAPFSVDIDKALHGAVDSGTSSPHTIEVDVHDPTEGMGQPLGKQRSLSGGMW